MIQPHPQLPLRLATTALVTLALSNAAQAETTSNWELYGATPLAEEAYVNADAYYCEVTDHAYPGECCPPHGVAPSAVDWRWQVLPQGLIYRSYLAGVHEPRMGAHWFYQQDQGWLFDAALGGRVGLLRFGTTDCHGTIHGWQLDVEGAAFPRLDLEHEWDLVSTDFRVGVPLTYGWGPWQTKLAYYHLSSHLGDELAIARPDLLATRINFSRDVAVAGLSYYATPELRIYGEAGWAFYSDGGSEPWEFQFGIDYSPICRLGCRPAPFLAVNGHLRQEVNYSGNLTVQSGLQWRGASGHLLRTGVHYFNGLSPQREFFRTFEHQIGAGIWFDY